MSAAPPLPPIEATLRALAARPRMPSCAAAAVPRALAECDALTLRAGPRVLVEHLSFVVRPGERWAVLGPNGAGKSTLLHTLSGVRAADAGQVRIDGRPLAQWRVDELARLRAVLQDGWVDPFEASVLDTVLTARHAAGRDAGHDDGQALALQALAAMDCAPLAARDVRGLSRGERQRVALATALTQDTPLVLLDEPTAHQDPRHQALVLQRLAALPRAFVASLHDLDAAARFATHALLLSGRGHWRAGPAATVLTAAHLSSVFECEVRMLELDGVRHFHATGQAADPAP